MIIFKGDFKKSKTFQGLPVYNNIFLKIKSGYYIPLWSNMEVWGEIKGRLDDNLKGQKFFDKIIDSYKQLHNNVSGIVSVHKNIFEFMRDLFTLIILDFPESVILEVMKQPYTMVNYKVIKNSLQLLTDKEDMKDILHWILKNNKYWGVDYVKLVLYALSGNYRILQFSPEQPEYQYIVHSVNYNLHEIVNVMNGHPKQPVCELSPNNKLFGNVIHYCILAPGQYSVHIYNNGKWVEVLNTIKCKKLSKKALIDMINEHSNTINEDVVLISTSLSKTGFLDRNGTIEMFFSIVLSSIGKVYYYKRVGNKETIYCIPTKWVRIYDGMTPKGMSLYHMIPQDCIKQKVLAYADDYINKHKTFGQIK